MLHVSSELKEIINTILKSEEYYLDEPVELLDLDVSDLEDMLENLSEKVFEWYVKHKIPDEIRKLCEEAEIFCSVFRVAEDGFIYREKISSHMIDYIVDAYLNKTRIALLLNREYDEDEGVLRVQFIFGHVVTPESERELDYILKVFCR